MSRIEKLKPWQEEEIPKYYQEYFKIRDGWKVYVYKNREVPGWIIEQPKKITEQKIIEERNIEIQSIMIELYGIDKFANRNSKVIHEDKFGRLLSKKVGEHNLNFVQVVNSTSEPNGKYKKYFLPVPLETERAKQAVAWTFGLEEDDYNPVVET